MSPSMPVTRWLPFVLAVIPAHAMLADGARFQPLGDLAGGQFYSEALGISADGTVVVGRSKSALAGTGYEPFRWSDATGMIGMGSLTTTQNFFGAAQAASADGAVIVGAAPQPFRWTANSGMIDLNSASTTGFEAGQALDVSADGSVVVGLGFDLSQGTPRGMEGFRWTAETGSVGIGALSEQVFDSFAHGVSADGRVLAGQSMSGPPDVEAIRWTAETGIVGLGGLTLVDGNFFYALGWGISADGSTIVGQARTDDFEEAFYWRQETGMTSLDPLRGTTFTSIAQDASADGSIIVGYAAGQAMIWDKAHGMRSIRTILESEHGLELGAWQLVFAQAVSDDGTRIAGFGFNPQGNVEAWLATIPPYCTRTCGDVDGSAGAADLADFAAFASCLEGSAPTSQSCLCSDLDGDGAISLQDFARFSTLFGTETAAAPPGCGS